MVDNYIIDENVDSFLKMNIHRKKQSQLINFIVYVLETYSKNIARLYSVSFYRLSKLARKFDGDLTPEVFETFKKRYYCIC